MCGIFGLYHFGTRTKNIDLKKVAYSIRLRGPDSEGFYSDQKIDLAFRRLAIVDTQNRANQPLFNKQKTKCIVFNGEIFNFKELKKQYLSGYEFQTRSDTEVILCLYEALGEKCVEKLNGNFAFAVWDIENEELFIGRDRFGTRPVYYYIDDKYFIFCSEMRGIFETKLVQKTLDPCGIIEYFTFQNFLTDKTLFKNIFLLPPGSTIKITHDKATFNKYWDPVITYEEDKGINHYKEELKFLLDQAVKRQLMRDPHIFLGSYLSSGIDSGSIAGITSKYIPHLLTFTGGWNMTTVDTEEAKFDERRKAEILANYFKTTHHEIVLNHGDMEWMVNRVVRVLEEPRMGMSYSNQYVARLASRFVKVCFAGTGGDEIFGGYPWRYNLVKDTNPESEEFENIHYNYWSRLIKDDEKKQFFSKEFIEKNKDFLKIPKIRYREVFKDLKFSHPIDKAMYFEMKTFLHGLLVIEDKISMNYSMETRVPFLDNDLVKFALKLPPRYKTDGNIGKIIMREIANDFLPEKITKLKKQGFSSPDQSWYKKESFEFVKDIVLTETPFFNKTYIERILTEHQKGQVNHRLLLWSLLNFNLIYQEICQTS